MAVDWTIPRTGVFRYHRVDYTTRLELGEITTLQPGGAITRNIDSDLKEQGSLPCVEPPTLGDDLIRIYYVVTDDAGAELSTPLATMHAVKASSRFSAAVESASLTLYSALLTLQQAALRESLTIAAGSVAVSEAAAICAALGLPVVASISMKQTTTDVSWPAGTTYLKIINWLLDYASFWSALPDTWGRVVLAPYESPSARAPVWEFADGANCIYLPEVSHESDAFDTPNVCVLTSSNPTGALTGSYENADPASPYSTVTRGREITLTETVDDAVDEADLDARAEKRLIAATASTEKVGIKHTFAPVTIGDAVGFAYSKHGLSMRATIQSQDISLTPSALTAATLKRVWEAPWVS